MASKRKRIEDADMAERLARLERLADMLDRGEISLPRDDKGNEANGFYADDMERVADFAEDMRGRIHYRATEAPNTTGQRKPDYIRIIGNRVVNSIIQNSKEVAATPEPKPFAVKRDSDELNAWVTLDFARLAEQGVNISRDLTQFDMAVLEACNSVYHANDGTQVSMATRDIWRGWGNTGAPSPKMQRAILESVRKLMRTFVVINFRDEVAKWKAKRGQRDAAGNYLGRVEGALLMAKVGVDKRGGVTRDCIVMTDSSPLCVYTPEQQFKNWKLDTWNVPVRKTPEVIGVIRWLSFWVTCLERDHRYKDILMSNVYQALKIPTGKTAGERMKQQTARKAIKATLDHWVKIGRIASWDFNPPKNGGREIYSLTINVYRAEISN